MLQTLGVLAALHVLRECCHDLSLLPVLNGAAGRVYLGIRPFHELVAVIGLGSFLLDETALCVHSTLVDGNLLLELRLDDPMSGSLAPHAVHHVCDPDQPLPCVSSPFKPLGYPAAHVGIDFVAMQIDMLETVNIRVRCVWRTWSGGEAVRITSCMVYGTFSSLRRRKGSGRRL